MRYPTRNPSLVLDLFILGPMGYLMAFDREWDDRDFLERRIRTKVLQHHTFTSQMLFGT